MCVGNETPHLTAQNLDGDSMTEYYKGDRIAELLAELEHAEKVFNHADADQLNDELRNKLIAAKAYVAITKAKLTSLQN